MREQYERGIAILTINARADQRPDSPTFLVVICQLVRHRMPLIRFFQTLRHRNALRFVVKRTCTFELSNMLGTQRKKPVTGVTGLL
jgi:hypothetical protein